tara:strand:- start:6 stop:614 length:609 start_codon:yes stop_codon:yes gene_type:complete
MIKIYHVAGTRGLRAIWACEELAIPYEVEVVSFDAEFRSSPEWRKLNPVGKVPAMTDDNLVMFESGAMVQYLVDRYGNGKLQPKAGTPDHALYLQWSWFAEATFSRPLGEVVNHGREFPGDKHIKAVVDEMKNRASLSLDAVANEMSDKEYLVANEFTAADIMMGYTLMLAKRLLDKPLPEKILPYWESLSSREGFQIAQAK